MLNPKLLPTLTGGWIILMVTLVSGVLSGPLFARSTVEELVESMSLEQLMTLEAGSTSFFETPIEKMPGSLYVISRETMDFSYGASLADYLSYYVPGAQISEFYDKGPLYTTRGTSGGSNGTTLFMLNSEKLNTSSGMPFNLNLPLLGFADRIEVLNGPCSLIHGSGSMNGFVNIIHKTGKDNPGSFLSVETGLNDGMIRMETGHGLPDTRIGDLYLYAGAVESDSLDRPAKQADAFTGPSFRTSFNLHKKNLTLTAFAEQEKFESSLPDLTRNPDDGYLQVEMKSYGAIPKLKFDISPFEDITISMPITYFEQSESVPQPDITGTSDEEFHFKTHLLFRTTRINRHKLAVGGTAFMLKKERNIQQYNFFDYGPGQPPAALADISLKLFCIGLSAYVEDTIEVTPRLDLFTGLRYDSVHAKDFTLDINDAGKTDIGFSGNYDEIVTPRLGVTYALSSEKFLTFMYQQGYSNPDYADRIGHNRLSDISTEKLESLELGYHQSLARERGKISLSAYYNIFRDTALQGYTRSQAGDSVAIPIVMDRFDVFGFEGAFTYHFDPRTSLWASYSYSRPVNFNTNGLAHPITSEDGDEWLIFPTHMIKLNVSHRFFNDRLEVLIGGLYNSSISTLQREPAPGSSSEDVFSHHRFVLNAAARYKLSKTLTLTLRGKNILDNDVPATGYYYNWGYGKDNTAFTHPEVYIGLNWKF